MWDPQREKYVKYATDAISGLNKIASEYSGKNLAKLPPELRQLTRSGIESIIHGLKGDPKYKSLVDKLTQLMPHALTKEKLVKYRLFENAEMAQSDVTKIIDYSEKLQSMFNTDDNLEDWVKAKLNHACDYVATVRDYLKFYHDEKESGTSDDQINEKWTNTYKKSINCSNPKGFSQKAHCKARRLRQMGKKTKSKPVREIYEVVVRHMLKEFNSSMAMGALKQLNSDAKELETHFGPQGRKFDEVKIAHNLEEGWKDWVAAGAIGLGAMSGKVDASKMKPTDQAAITQSVQKSVGSFMDYIKKVENQGKVGYNAEKKLWFPHKSFEGGSDTIGYGHKIQKGEDFSKGITDAQAESLLKTDLAKAKQQVYKELGSVKLTPQQEEMFVDFVFNMGTLKKFPKFTEFALKNDLEGMKSQYKRYAGGKELKGRNSEFLKRFLSEYFGFTTYF